SSSCSIPEFVCNLGAWLSRSPILKSYADILNKSEETESLLKVDECIKHDALHVFRKAIAEPLLQLELSRSVQGSLVIVVDGTDEAEFHRSEDGRSIGTFICTLIPHLPPWLDNHLLSNPRRSIIDPFGDLVDRIVYAANGNVLYIRLLLRLVETGRLPLRYLLQTNLPADDLDLYGLIMELTFTSPATFARVAPVLDVFLASLRPLDRNTLLSVFNSPKSDVPMMDMQLDEMHGHILFALHLTHQAPLSSVQLFELAHHLLKAHPYKYMHGKYMPEFTSLKDGQIDWIKQCSEDIRKALFNHRNMFFPNTKASDHKC
ncbi:hypothetical protein OSTOST_17500, partial [Ostertagia ostertagi]